MGILLTLIVFSYTQPVIDSVENLEYQKDIEIKNVENYRDLT
jgi:hypothetical protein